ncbi:MAG TPA: HD domain-containing phosphohydrolase [Rhodocyclaceae bacterium]
MAHRIITNEIHVGKPLPWNVFDAGGVLLLRRGVVITSQHALDRLIEEGIYLDEQDSQGLGRSGPAAVAEPEKPSALQLVTDARRLFGTLLNELRSVSDFPARIRRIALLVDLACQTNPEVALATILLLQDDSYAVRHHLNTAIMANLLCRAMALPDEQAQAVLAAALTMNASMYEVQDKLNDVKGPLNDKLRALIASHPEQSEQRLRQLGVADALWLRCVAQHHECENGAGYPGHLTGDAIEQGAKIIGLADRYCAQVSNRHYHPARAPGIVLKELYAEKGAEIDTTVAAHLVRVVGIYPPGTIVRLKNGEVAVVVAPTDNADSPLACAVLGANRIAFTVPAMRKTIKSDFKITEVMTLDKIDFPIQMSRIWGDAARIG